MGVIPVLLKGFTLNSKDGNSSSSHRSGGVVLGGENVAGGPAHIGTKLDQGFDQNSGLNRHVQRAGDPGPLQRLLLAVLCTQCHQTGHLGLSNIEFLASKIG